MSGSPTFHTCLTEYWVALHVVTKFCDADPGQSQPTACVSLASGRLYIPQEIK